MLIKLLNKYTRVWKFFNDSLKRNFRRKKSSELEKSWGKMMSKEELGAELVAYLNRIMKVPQPVNTEKEKKRTLSAFDKKMLKEFGPGHPEKPRPVHSRFTDEVKSENPDLTKQEISALYKKAQKKRTIGHLLGQIEKYKKSSFLSGLRSRSSIFGSL